MIDEPEMQEPFHRAQQPEFLTNKTFDSFDIPKEVVSGLQEAGFTRCTPIQAAVLPVALEGRDIAGQAQTGTGKTAAFLVPLYKKLLAAPPSHPGLPKALIVAPTRELAIQILEEAEQVGKFTALSLSLVVGGIDYRQQADSLKRGTDIVVGTPGRIIDYMKQGIFQTKDIEVVVIDEADRLLDLGFAKDMRWILRKLPHYSNRQSMLFSATLSYRVLELTYEFMNLPEFIDVSPQEVTVEGIDQSLFHVGMGKKLPLLLGLLEREDWSRMLIFVNTKSGVEWLAHKLKGNGLPAEGITGDVPQKKRLRLMERFKDGQLKILIATDVASRGIHVEDISHVINYDLPQDPENYVHRIGRTARAGKTGTSLTLACETYVYHLEPIEKLLGFSIPVVWQEDDWLIRDKAGPPPAKKRRTTATKPGDRNRPGRGAIRSGRRGGKASPGKAVGQAQAKPEGDSPEKKNKRKRSRRRKPAGPAKTEAQGNATPGPSKAD